MKYCSDFSKKVGDDIQALVKIAPNRIMKSNYLTSSQIHHILNVVDGRNVLRIFKAAADYADHAHSQEFVHALKKQQLLHIIKVLLVISALDQDKPSDKDTWWRRS